MIEGLAEATALLVKVVSGAISDWLGRRKPLTVLGYAQRTHQACRWPRCRWSWW